MNDEDRHIIQSQADEKINPLEPLRGETQRANSALYDYALLGVSRSLRILLEKYRRLDSQWTVESGIIKPPTSSWTTLTTWSGRWDWQRRVAVFDESVKRREVEAYFESQKKWKKNREQILSGTFGLLASVLNEKVKQTKLVDEDEGLSALAGSISIGELARAIALLTTEVRTEWGEPGAPESGVAKSSRIKMIVAHTGPAGETRVGVELAEE